MTDDQQVLGDRNLPMCPICGNNTFRQGARQDRQQWGMTAHRVTLLICQRCAYVLASYDGNTIFDFD